MNHRPHVVVIGGGYSGTLAANHLRMRGDLDITLVNPRPRFVERIRLHQLVAGTADATVDYGDLLGEGIRLVVDTATRIDTAARSVELASGDALRYDYVIYAVGSTGAVSESVPGAAESAYPVAELEQAQRLRVAVDELHPDAPVTVVGGGLTGIEVATELAEQGRRITLVCGGRLGPSLSEPGRRSVAKALAKLRIAVMENDVVTEVRPDAVVFADGAVRPSALTIWTGGFGVPELAVASGLRTDAMGRLLTDETLTSLDDPRIIAAGDCAAPSGEPLRMCCASASQLGPQAANTVLSRIAGTEPAVFEYGFAGTCTSLGRRTGIVQFGRRDDTPVDVYVGGRIAAVLKEIICKGTIWGLRREARKPGSAFWFKGGPRPQQPAVEVGTAP
ncbi:pyridine nucleotide-disulfide oxidoreductase [Mycobacterium sp. IS-1496]|uniref:NAD(P)/FAD-dependent oxidoreductase n=1 Tax=Mycobacterium sp. IS-1496 TaxID=1772284 RepID=UPI00074174ED|nr:FAD-dependent oxidoreductase [Mycobacterium sp. IS-1496]KUI29394.1 pyridine nucleotide-disulfide oxidoreductase [Mycobacterium sp. IS-1496]